MVDLQDLIRELERGDRVRVERSERIESEIYVTGVYGSGQPQSIMKTALDEDREFLDEVDAELHVTGKDVYVGRDCDLLLGDDVFYFRKQGIDWLEMDYSRLDIEK